MVNKITENDYKAMDMSGVKFLDFNATWCGPCRMIAPAVEALSEEMTDVTFLSIDVDQCPNLAEQFNIMSIPALVVLKDGKQVGMKVGAMPKEALEDFINSVK